MQKKFKKIISMLLLMVMFFNTVIYNTVSVFADTGIGNFPLVASVTDAGNGKNNLSFDWEPTTAYGDEGKEQYFLVRKNLETGEWDLRGNYANMDIRVLNVYPDVPDSAGLKSWVEGLKEIKPSIGITVDPVDITSFNESPDTYLYKDKFGLYNYDVVVFGFWDSNNGLDLSTKARNVIETFIIENGGVIFGHDTISYKGQNPNFSYLIEKYLQIYPRDRDITQRMYSDKIKINKQSSLTTYPFDINGMELTIPVSHTLENTPKKQDNIYMSFTPNYYPSEGDGPYFNYTYSGSSPVEVIVEEDGVMYNTNYYLLADGNVSYIQTGHTSGKSNLPEQMVLVNLIYAMAQINTTTHGVDQAIDEKAPSIPTVIKVPGENTLQFTSTDMASEYVYRIIQAPVGYSMRENWSQFKYSLDNSSKYVDTDEGATIYFSQPTETVSAFSDLSHYVYTIDHNEFTEAEHDDEVLALDGQINFPSPSEGLEKDVYLHIAAVDKANNKSETRHINLWDELEDTEVDVYFKNELISAGMEEDIPGHPMETYTGKVGSEFTNNHPSISNYLYSRSEPGETIILENGETRNQIKHIYNKVISTQIYAVEDRDGTKSIFKTIASFGSVEGSEFTYPIEDLSDDFRTYKGYYTVGSKDGTPIPFELPGEFSFRTEPGVEYFFHYLAEKSTATVNVVDKVNGIDYGSYVQEGFIGDSMHISGRSVLEAVPIPNLECYENAEVFNGTINIPYLEKDPSDNVIEIVLEPKTKIVEYIGIDNTSSSGIIIKDITDIQGYSEHPVLTYDGTNAITPIEDDLILADGWEVSENNEQQIDFTTESPIYFATYTKGAGIPRFSYKTSYINALDNSEIIPSKTVSNQLVGEKINVDVQKLEDITVSGTTRPVDFRFDHITVSYGGDVISGAENIILPNHVNDYMPIKSGDDYLTTEEYAIDIYYKPYVNINFKEYLDGETEPRYETNYRAVYSDSKAFDLNSGFSLDKYKAINTTVNGVDVTDTFDHTVIPNEYDIEVVSIYDLMKYNLIYGAVDFSDSGINYYEKYYNNIPVGVTIHLDPIDLPNHEYVTTETVDGTPSEYLSGIDFTATDEGDYKVNSIYKTLSSLNIHYYDLSGNEILAPILNKEVYIGETIDLTEIPASLEDYKLKKVYIDNEPYNPILDGNMFEITQLRHTIRLYYVPRDYQLDVTYSAGGTAVGSGLYPEGAKINIVAFPDEGYEFSHWTVESGSGIEVVDVNQSNTFLTMPKGDAAVKAHFVEEDERPINPIDPGKPIDPIDPEKPEKPEKPTEPVDPTEPEILDPDNGKVTIMLPSLNPNKPPLVLRQGVRYKPYIDGYDTGLAGPTDSITRAEVVQIMYNLLHPSYVEVDMRYAKGFDDISEDSWYTEAVAFCVEYGLIAPNDVFRPNDEITRAEIAVILSRIIVNAVEYQVDTTFSDTEGHWAEEYINLLQANDIAFGFTDGSFKPDAVSSRAEFCAFLNRTLKRPDGYGTSITFPDLPESYWAYDDMMNAANGNYEGYLKSKKEVIEEVMEEVIEQ